MFCSDKVKFSHLDALLFMVCLLLCRRNLEELLPRFGYDKDITAKDEFIHLVSDSGNQPVATAAFSLHISPKPGCANSCLLVRPNNPPEDSRHFGKLELTQIVGLASPQVTCGYASDALTQFLSTGLTDTQLARMRKAVDTGTGQVLESMSSL